MMLKNFKEKWEKNGIIIFFKHTTGCIWLTEDEILHHADVRFLDSIAPKWKDPEGSQKILNIYMI